MPERQSRACLVPPLRKGARIRERWRMGRVASPETWVAILFAIELATGCGWGLPGSDSWAADSLSPRSCGLGAIVETYRRGHFHTYPPLQMAVLTILSLPWIALGAARVGIGEDALAAELVKPLYMTAIEASSRVVAAILAVSTLLLTMRLWGRLFGRPVGVMAGIVLALNATFVYYGHTGNLEVPYIFWLSWGMLEMDRVISGDPREAQVLFLATAAVLTKDQAAAALLLPLPLALGLMPWLVRRESPLRRRLQLGALASGMVVVVASGALVNPGGFQRRIAFLLGPASQSWAAYPRGAAGARALLRDAVAATPHLSSWGFLLAALVGVAVASSLPGVDRVRALAPLVAATSFALFFTLAARRSEDRFLLPESVFFFPYAAVAFEWSRKRFARWRWAVGPAAAATAIPALLSVASMDGTLLADPRYEAERFLAGLPIGTKVEVYGGPIFLPRVPAALGALRPGIEPLAERQAVAGVTDLVDPALDIRSRAPDIVVLGTELSHEVAPQPTLKSRPFGLMQYADERSHALLRSLADGTLGYERVLRATCLLPFPLSCRTIHGSTGGEVWVYARAASRVGRVP